jgi:hypothetical protein
MVGDRSSRLQTILDAMLGPPMKRSPEIIDNIIIITTICIIMSDAKVQK